MQKTILESWIKYIDLESLEQAKFDPQKTNTKRFCDMVVAALLPPTPGNCGMN